jgi:hypothetical protein
VTQVQIFGLVLSINVHVQTLFHSISSLGILPKYNLQAIKMLAVELL